MIGFHSHKDIQMLKNADNKGFGVLCVSPSASKDR